MSKKDSVTPTTGFQSYFMSVEIDSLSFLPKQRLCHIESPQETAGYFQRSGYGETMRGNAVPQPINRGRYREQGHHLQTENLREGTF